MAATIKDIVKMTGLSLGTVSKYLNGVPIKRENAERIRLAVEELDYRVNEFGRNLKTNRSHTVGVIVPQLEDPFAASIAALVGKYMRRANYGVIISNLDTDLDCEEKLLEFLQKKRADGVMFFPMSSNAELYQTYAKKFPMIAFDSYLEGLRADAIVLDNRRAARDAADYLIARGHRQIAILTGKGAYSANLRLQGFVEAMEAADISVEPAYVRRTRYNVAEQALSQALELLTMERPPTAILACNYYFTIGVIVACERLGLKLGEDVSLIGFDRMLLTDIMWPNVTCVVQPLEQMAERGTRLLIDRIRGERTEGPELFQFAGSIAEGTSVKNLNA